MTHAVIMWWFRLNIYIMGSFGSRFQSTPRGSEDTAERQCAGSRHGCECRKRKRSSRCECDSELEEDDSQLDTPRRCVISCFMKSV